MEETIARRKRINRLKKMILGLIGMAILIPVTICIFLGWKISVLTERVGELTLMLEEAQMKEQEQEVGIFTTAHIEESPREAKAEQMSQTEEPPEEQPVYAKRVYLTFDDGPSSSTAQILDILKAYDVKATFFVVGKADETSKALYQRIVAEGHTLGMHSYSHKYDEIYASKESFIQDLTMLQEYLYEVTGVWPRYYRFPGGSSNAVSKTDMQELIGYLNEQDIVYFDWNVASGDAVNGYVAKDTLINNCLKGIQMQTDSIVLMHDASERRSTVEALPEVIAQVRMRGDACFMAITDETPKLQHVKEK